MKQHLWWVRRKYSNSGWECSVYKYDCYDTRAQARSAVKKRAYGYYWNRRGMQRIHKLTISVDGLL